MTTRDSDTSLWLHNKLGTSNDSWISGSICSQLNKEVLRNIKECFPDLQTQVKLKLLLSFFHIPRRLVEEWKAELEEVIEVAGLDSELWVSMLAESMKTFPATSSLNTEISDYEDTRPIFTDMVNDLRKLVSKHSDLGMLPLECQYLNKNALVSVVGQQPNTVKHFTIKRKPKSATLRTELLHKSADAQSSLKKASAPTIPLRSRGMPRKMTDTTPLKGIPSRVPTSGFRSPSINATNAQRPNLSRTPAGRKDGGIKLIELSEQPLGYAAAKKRKREQQLEEQARKQEQKAAAAAAAAATAAGSTSPSAANNSSQSGKEANTPTTPTSANNSFEIKTETNLLNQSQSSSADEGHASDTKEDIKPVIIAATATIKEDEKPSVTPEYAPPSLSYAQNTPAGILDSVNNSQLEDTKPNTQTLIKTIMPSQSPEKATITLQTQQQQQQQPQQKEQEHESVKEPTQQEQEIEKETVTVTVTEDNKHHIKTQNKIENKQVIEDKKDTKEIITASQLENPETVNSNNNNSSLKSANNNSTATVAAAASSDITVKDLKLIEESSLSAKSPLTSPPPPPDPIDWKPNDKCHFCVNGKLLTVNAKGELVAESGPTGSETDHIQKLDCESDSNESSSVAANTNGNLPLMTGTTESLTDNNRVRLNKLLTQKMASMDSVAAQFAAIQSMLPNFNWMNQQQQQQQSQPDSVTPTTSDTSAAAISPSLKDSPSPSDATGEQPLDLSSKPSPNSSVSGDLKSVRIKSSRATPVPSTRRTYSEEDLNNALQEILSGRLGTRKAAVQFNVPRSTLRNKIYKLTTEAKRNNEQASPELLQLQQELEKEMSGDEEPELESNSSTPQPDDVVVTRVSTPNLLKKLCINNGEGLEVGSHPEDQNSMLHASPKPAHAESSKPQTTEGLPEHNTQAQITALDAALPLLLQTLLLSDKNLRDVFSALLLNSTNNLKDILLGATTAANSAAAASGSENNSLNNGNQQQDYRPLLQMLLQQQQQQQQQPTSFASGRRLPKSDTPETNSSLDPNEACDDPSAILKIPSYTPVAGPSNSMGPSSSRGSPALVCHNSNSNSNRNGDSPGPLLLAAAVAQKLSSKNLSVTPPLLHAGVDNQSPQSLRISDVIANSIHRTMNEQVNKEAVHAGSVSLLGYGANTERNSVGSMSTPGDYKKPTISVVKNIGGTDTSRFGTAPNLLAADLVQHHHHSAHLQHAHHLSRQEAAALAAGKGTRPKRGKYRNYDRDSLVEAVKAVQRGEMSVHRAGSYYGVPHSTLEYKVKERHLMRPRKREPKPQPGLDGTSNSSKTNANIPAGLTGLDKLKAGNGGANSNLKLGGAGMKNNGGTGANAFPGNAANGMKLPIFDPSLAHLQYTSPLFWQHNQAAAFSQLQMDFNRNSTAPSATSPNEANSDILKNHMQRYQDMTGGGGGGAGSVGGNTTTNSSNGPSPVSSPILSGQDINRARELYESNAANGASFLDGIIRKSLDRKSNEVSAASTSTSGGVLLDQLLMKKTPLPFTNNRSNEYNSLSPSHLGAIKRSGSPLSLSGTSIKRERNSPHSGPASDDDDETSQSGVDESYENNNNKSGNGGLKSSLSQRSRLGSRDSNSETDNSSLKSELHHQHQGHHNNGNSAINMLDINGVGVGGGGSSSCGGVNVKTEIPNLETGTSILQEKLSQIKAEQQESEENL